jgi:hypothetical protein
MAGSPPLVSDDSGDIVLGWLSKIAIVLGLLGLVLFDAISIGTTAVSLSDQGSYAARQASETWLQTKSVQQAYDAAAAAVTEQNPHNTVSTKSFTVDTDGTVHLTVAREATTLLVFRLSQTKKWGQLEREAQGLSVSG